MSVLTDLRAALERRPALSCDDWQRDYIELLEAERDALLKVVEAAREVIIYIDQDYFNADEERVFGALDDALAQLVKEVDDALET